MIELRNETIWFDQRKFEEAESLYQRSLVQKEGHASPPRSSIVDQIAKARETIKQTLEQERGHSDESSTSGVGQRLSSLEKENQQLKKVIENIQASLCKLEERVANIEVSKGNGAPVSSTKVEPEPKKVDNDDDSDDDDDDLFGSEDEEEKERVNQMRIQQYADKKSKKPAVIAKSNIILDVKPWDDETDMAKLEECVRSVKKDGLVWGTSKLAAVGYGIKKLVITCVVEDDKVGTDDLEEWITAFEEYVQSVDVAAFNKV
ncbi:elongation factor 1-delta isoform X6 [Paramuricea clavata]|uniref:Elongation factor 1-delta isoform X6 n=1 Tax=Paramuricea clavata TaxID=317549 RepID=A0A7D9E2D6_PARCT|nr:elongation factor 1-delta isoform X6 [Paramuricea clavata]